MLDLLLEMQKEDRPGKEGRTFYFVAEEEERPLK